MKQNHNAATSTLDLDLVRSAIVENGDDWELEVAGKYSLKLFCGLISISIRKSGSGQTGAFAIKYQYHHQMMPESLFWQVIADDWTADRLAVEIINRWEDEGIRNTITGIFGCMPGPDSIRQTRQTIWQRKQKPSNTDAGGNPGSLKEAAK